VFLSPFYFSGCSNRHDGGQDPVKNCAYFSQIYKTNKHLFPLLKHIPT
jgi:hypothetical protein